MAKDDENKPATGHESAWAIFQLVECLLDVAEVHAAHAATSPAAGAWRKLVGCCHEILGDDEKADAARATAEPSPYAYGSAPAFMPPGPEPTPGIPASRRDEIKRERRK